jgi:microcystin-dependent protein
MANLTETSQWETGIYRIETTDPVIGGETGISNKQAKLLGNRTLYLKGQTDDHETRITSTEASANILNKLKGSASLVKHGVVTSALNGNVFDFVSVAKITSSPILNRITVTANVDSPLVIAFSRPYDSSGPSNYYGFVSSNQIIDSGSNSSGLLYAAYDITTGAVTFGLDTAITSVIVSYSAPSNTSVYWYSLKDEALYLWNGIKWMVQSRVIIASISWSGSGSRTYFLPIGKGMKDVFGRGQVPAGTLNAFAGASAPDGFLLCNGGAISRSIYSDLFAAIGTTYGAGDGSTTFNIPDLRGEFLRGLDGGRGVDLNTQTFTGSITNGSTSVTALTSTAELAVGMSVTGTGIPASTTIAAIVSGTAITLSAAATVSNGGASLTFAGRMIGSWQPATRIQAHVGTQGSQLAVAAQNPDATESYSIAGQTGTSFGTSQTFVRNLTRPRNVAVNYVIKF